MNAATVCVSYILESQIGIFATAIFHDVTRLHSRNAHAPSRCPNPAGRNFPLQLPRQPKTSARATRLFRAIA